MKPNEELHQQVWELVYDLLDDDDAEAARELITSDPEVARLYSKVKIQSEMLGRAAKLEAERFSWQRPTDASKAGDDAAQPQVASSMRLLSTGAKAANWLVSAAALVLVCVMSFALLKSDSPFRTVAVSPESLPAVRAVVTAPAKLHPEVTNSFLINTTTLGDATPQATDLRYRVVNSKGDVRLEERGRTNAAGNLEIQVGKELLATGNQLEVIPTQSAPIAQALDPSPSKLVTYLRTDRPLYQPGETVLFRSVTLSRFGLNVDREATVDFDVLDGDGNSLSNAQTSGMTQQGVGGGEYKLPDDVAAGNYSVLARSPAGEFPEQWRDFTVANYELPRIEKKLELAKDSYTVGEEVEVQLFAKLRSDDKPANFDVFYDLRLAGQPVTLPEPQAKTDADGNHTVRFNLPAQIAVPEATLTATITDGDHKESISEPIPINLGKVNVDFYPEGGDLVAGARNRVYFYARDPVGKPVHVAGTVFDSSGEELAKAATIHEGRGVFAITPSSDQRYHFNVESPERAASEIPLPAVDEDQLYGLSVDSGVIGAGESLDVTVATRDITTPLVVAAYCRGAQVGQAHVDRNEYTEGLGAATASTSVSLAPEAQGVVRVTAYDFSEEPPKPVAERLVFRRFSTRWDVEVANPATSFARGENVDLEVQITNEAGDPATSALGIAVVDDALLNLADDKSTRLPTYFQLLTEIDHAEQLEDANYYLSDEEGAAEALDLLLGTQGWRRFVEVRADQLALNDQVWSYDNAQYWYRGRRQDDSLSLGRLIALDDRSLPPVVADNTAQVKAERRWRETQLRRDRRLEIRRYGLVGLCGGVAVLFALVLLGVCRASTGPRVALPTAVVALLLIGVGTLWSSASIDRSGDVVFGSLPISSRGAEVAAVPPADSAVVEQAAGAAFTDDIVRLEVAPEAEAPTLDRVSPKSVESMVESLDAPVETVPLPMAAPTADAPAAERFRQELAQRPLAERLQRQLSRAATAVEQPVRRRSAQAPALELREIEAEANRRAVGKTFLLRRYAYLPPPESDSVLQTGDTLFWAPLVPTDDSGTATVRFKLPNSPATYRALIEAHGDGRLGSGDMLIRVGEE